MGTFGDEKWGFSIKFGVVLDEATFSGICTPLSPKTLCLQEIELDDATFCELGGPFWAKTLALHGPLTKTVGVGGLSGMTCWTVNPGGFSQGTIPQTCF